MKTKKHHDRQWNTFLHYVYQGMMGVKPSFHLGNYVEHVIRHNGPTISPEEVLHENQPDRLIELFAEAVVGQSYFKAMNNNESIPEEYRFLFYCNLYLVW